MKKILITAASAALLGGVLLIAPGTAKAAGYDLYVAPIGPGTTHTYDDGGVSCKRADFPTIQLALDHASAGDRIFICAGTYEGNYNVYDDNLELVGAGSTKTILVGTSDDDPILSTLDNPGISALTVRNLSLSGGESVYGGAIWANYGTVTCINSSFIGNAAQYGGAVYAELITARNCNFVNNYASDGGGAIYAYDESQVFNSRFTGNYGYNYAGAIAGSDAYIAKSFFSDNGSAGAGGAVGVWRAHVDSTKFISNWGSIGGALYGDEAVAVSQTLFRDNSAVGAGNAVLAPVVSLAKVTFQSNHGSCTSLDYMVLSKSIGVKWSNDQEDNCPL